MSNSTDRDYVHNSDLPAGFKPWPNRRGADSRTWTCMKRMDGSWVCRAHGSSTARTVKSLFALKARRR